MTLVLPSSGTVGACLTPIPPPSAAFLLRQAFSSPLFYWSPIVKKSDLVRFSSREGLSVRSSLFWWKLTSRLRFFFSPFERLFSPLRPTIVPYSPFYLERSGAGKFFCGLLSSFPLFCTLSILCVVCLLGPQDRFPLVRRNCPDSLVLSFHDFVDTYVIMLFLGCDPEVSRSDGRAVFFISPTSACCLPPCNPPMTLFFPFPSLPSCEFFPF